MSEAAKVKTSLVARTRSVAAAACEETPPGKDGRERRGEGGGGRVWERLGEGESTGEAGRREERESMGEQRPEEGRRGECGRREEGETMGEGRRGIVWEKGGGESIGEAGRREEEVSMGEDGRREEGESKREAGRREEGRVWERTNRAGWWVRQYSLRSVTTFQHLLRCNITGHFAT